MISQLEPALLFDSNMFVIIGSKGTALIDTGTGFQSASTIASVDKRLEGRPLDHLFLTHRHYDHVGGASAIIERFHPRVHAGSADAEPLRQGDSESTLGTKFGGSIPKMDVEDLSEGDEFDLGGHVLRVIETPGHTIGSICLLDAATGSLFSGDTFFFDGVGNWEHPTGSLEDLRASLERLKGFQFDALYPGHGPAIKTGGRKCLDKAIQLTGGRV